MIAAVFPLAQLWKKGEICPRNIWQTALLRTWEEFHRKTFLGGEADWVVGGGGEMQDFFADFFLFASAAVSFWWEWQWIVFPIRFFFFSLRIFPLPAKGQKKESDKKRNILGIITLRGQTQSSTPFLEKKIFDLVTHLSSFFPLFPDWSHPAAARMRGGTPGGRQAPGQQGSERRSPGRSGERNNNDTFCTFYKFY